ncbi:NAD-dependent epimerase/dehydratase family protein [Aureibaculum conchae]|uniref:NAD-dependent epimerase/dehydratase family protein n=1 Tax=Aureibaculum sp. 2308TA14-22 TaxID=3108392 RepID=UPI0033978276
MLNKQSKILLTGASGFLGSYIYNYLNSKYNVTTLGRSKASSIVCNISEAKVNLADNYQMVIHCAGKAHSIPKSKQEEKIFYDVNHKGTINLCESLKPKLPSTFVFISTIAVYGLDKGSNIREEEPLNGATPYAKSKIMAEKFLQGWCKQKDINLVILRLPLVAGINPKGNLEAMINGIKKGYYFNISGNDAKKSIVLADDVAKLIPNLYNKHGVYNLSGDRDYTFKQISEIIRKQLGKKRIITLSHFLVKISSYVGNVIPFFPLNGDTVKKMTSTLTVSANKAISELSWKPKALEDHFKIS